MRSRLSSPLVPLRTNAVSWSQLMVLAPKMLRYLDHYIRTLIAAWKLPCEFRTNKAKLTRRGQNCSSYAALNY